jgi:hypothetical protein
MWNLASYLMCKESLINSNSVHWSWPEDGTARQHFERGSPKDYFSKAWIHDWPCSLRGKHLKFHPPFLFLPTVAMLVGCLDCRTQFWKGVIKGLSKVSLVSSCQVVSEENMFSNCVRTDGRRKVMTKAHLTLRRGCILFSIRGKIHGFNNNLLICNRWNGTFWEFSTPSSSPEDYILHWK